MSGRKWKKDYFSFRGRLSRAPFFKRMMIVVAILAAIAVIWFSSLNIIDDMGETLLGPGGGYSAIMFVPMLMLLVAAWPAVSLLVRRLHDIGLSGWWILAYVPISFFEDMLDSFGTSGGAALSFLVELAVVLFIFACPGAAGPNRFGPSGPVAEQ